MQLIQKIKIGLVLVVAFGLLTLALPTPTQAACGGDCSVVCGCFKWDRWGSCVREKCFTECGGNGCQQVGCGPGQYECNRAGGCCDVGPVDNCPCGTKPSGVCNSCEPEPPPPPPPCVVTSWGEWSVCSASCGGGTQIRTNNCGGNEGRVCNTQSCQGPWWQVNDGDITSSGDIVSRLPSGKYLNTVGSGGFPGIPVYNGQIGTAPGTISSTGWNANTETSLTRIFNYSFFENLIPPDIVINDISKLTTGAGTTLDANGYEWYKITGNLDTVGNIDFGSRKVILFVKSGNFNINGKINLDDNNGFFVVFVNGNINITASVTGTPAIEGMYTADSGFTTGLGNTQLHIRGSVASYGGITLQRDLPDDTVTPAELFEFAPDQVVLFPQKLMFKRIKWAEVAP